jgi:hypothetical protein
MTGYGPKRRRGQPRKLTRAEIDQIRILYRKYSAPQIGRLFRVSSGTVLRAVDGKIKASDE